MTKWLFGALAVIVLFGAIACSKITKENYDRIQMGMDYSEVVLILGKPESCDAIFTARNCRWGTSPKTITIKLLADKVILFESEGL